MCLNLLKNTKKKLILGDKNGLMLCGRFFLVLFV